MNSDSKSSVLYESLDSSFVNLWALLRHLSRRKFVGRVHVELSDYTADVFLDGSNTPLVHEVDRATGTDVIEESALHRLVLRARAAPGSITVFEGADEAAAARELSDTKTITKESAPLASSESAARQTANQQTIADDKAAAEPVEKRPATASETKPSIDDYSTRAGPFTDDSEPAGRVDWGDVVKTSGELIGAVERALTGAGADFNSLFSAARLELADDYTFLDPISDRFQYANSVITLSEELPVTSFVTGLSEALRRVVDKAATGERARRLRERVALELALAARRRDEVLRRSGLRDQLDRIAGTKVI